MLLCIDAKGSDNAIVLDTNYNVCFTVLLIYHSFQLEYVYEVLCRVAGNCVPRFHPFMFRRTAADRILIQHHCEWHHECRGARWVNGRVSTQLLWRGSKGGWALTVRVGSRGSEAGPNSSVWRNEIKIIAAMVRVPGETKWSVWVYENIICIICVLSINKSLLCNSHVYEC